MIGAVCCLCMTKNKLQEALLQQLECCLTKHKIQEELQLQVCGIDSIVLGAVCVVLYDKEQAPRGTSSTVRMVSDKTQAPRGTSIASTWD